MKIPLLLVFLLSMVSFVAAVPVANNEVAEDEVFPDDVVQMDEAGEASKRLISESTGKYDVPTPEPPNVLSFNVDRCEANSIKKKDCNRCKCGRNGQGWLCTRRDCSKFRK